MTEAKKPRQKRRRFTAEYKAEVVSLCEVGDRSIGQVSQDLGLTETSVRAWVQRAEIDAGKGPPGVLTTSEREEMVRLRRETQAGHDGARHFKKSDGIFVNVRRNPMVAIVRSSGTRPKSDQFRGYQSRGVWRCAQAQGVSFATSVSTAMSSSTSAT